MLNKLLVCISICLVFVFKIGVSQPQWISFTSDLGAHSICIEGTNLWVCTDVGLVKIDTTTGIKTVYDDLNVFPFIYQFRQVAPASMGGVWVSTNKGLIHFDGTILNTYITTGLGDTMNYIYNLKYDSNGNLWFFSLLGSSSIRSLVKFDGANFTSFNLSTVCSGIQFGSADFDIDNSNNLWIASGCGLLRFDGASFILYDSLNTNFQYSNMNYLVKDQSGKLWTSDDHFLYSFNGTNWTMLSDSFSVAAAEMNQAYADLDGGLFFSDGFRLITKNNAGSWAEMTNYFPNSPQFMSVTTIIFDASGRYWIGSGTQQPGYKVVRWQGNSYKTYDVSKSGSRQYWPREIAFDRHNKKYLVANGLLSTFDGLNWGAITTPYPFPFNIASIYCAELELDKYDNLWFANSNQYTTGHTNGVIKYDGQNFISHSIDDLVFDICLHNGETPWIISADSTRLAFLDNGNWTWIDSSQTHIKNPTSIVEDLNHNIWITGWNQGVSRFDGATWTPFNMSNSSIPDSNLYFPICDSLGNLWFINSGKLMKYDGINWSSFPLPTGTTNIYGMTSGRNAIWYLSNLGLVEYDGTFSTIPFMFTNYQFSDMEFDRANNLWLIKAGGVYVYNPDGVDVNTLIASPSANISGECFYDVNNNAQRDSLEPGLPNQRLILSPDSIMNISLNNGQYNLIADSGVHVLSVIPTTHWVISTDSLTYTIYTDTSDVCCYDFGFTTDYLFDSVSISMNATRTRCNTNSFYFVEITNQGTSIFTGTVTVQFDSAITYLSSDVSPSNVFGNTIEYNVTGLYPLMKWKAKLFVMNPAAQGLALTSTATVSNGSLSFISTANETVVCSYDPNDKTAIPPGIGPQSLTPPDKPIDYVIRFENLGTDTAYTVHILDTIDTSFDLNTLLLVSSSHPVQVNVTSNVVDFDFHRIMLPHKNIDSLNSQGFVRFQIKPKPGLLNNTVVKNRAYIYFDFNPAVETNETFNTLSTTLASINKTEMESGKINVYPVPASESVLIHTETGNGLFYLYDYTGRIQKKIEIRSKLSELRIMDLPSGIYYYNYVDGDSEKSISGKLVVVK